MHFVDLKAFGKWAKEAHGLTSSAVLKIAQDAGFGITTSLELTQIINDPKLMAAILGAK